MCKGGTSTIKLPICKRDKKGQYTLLELFKFYLRYSMIESLGEIFFYFCASILNLMHSEWIR